FTMVIVTILANTTQIPTPASATVSVTLYARGIRVSLSVNAVEASVWAPMTTTADSVTTASALAEAATNLAAPFSTGCGASFTRRTRVGRERAEPCPLSQRGQPPGAPRIRTCGFPASGSSDYSFASGPGFWSSGQ